MDRQYLERRREQELERAETATSEVSRTVHRKFASLYNAVLDGRLTLFRGRD